MLPPLIIMPEYLITKREKCEALHYINCKVAGCQGHTDTLVPLSEALEHIATRSVQFDEPMITDAQRIRFEQGLR